MAADPVTPNDIDTWLRLDNTVDTASANLVIRVSFGWIIGRTSFTTQPGAGAVPEDLWSAWLELAGLAYDNPTMLASNQAGEEITVWSTGPVTRAAVILDQLADSYPKNVNAPMGSFPSALANGPWPDSSADVNTFGRLPWWWSR